MEKINFFYENLDVSTGKQVNIGKAFVIFKNQRDVRFLDDKYDQSLAGKIWYFMLAKCCCRKTTGYPEYVYDGNDGSSHHRRIYISRAPEPTDVYWENLGITDCKRFGYILLTYFATLTALAVVFAISYGLNRYKTDVENDYNKAKAQGTSSIQDLILVRGLSFATSLIVVFFNNLLVILIRKFSISERHETYTKYNVSVAFKLCVATFVNSAIIPLVVNIDQDT